MPNSKRDEDVHEKWWMESLDKLGRIRKRAVVKQDNAPTELVMFSQPPLVDLTALKSYNYDDSAGTDITVYVLDTGYYTKNSVSAYFFRHVRACSNNIRRTGVHWHG